MFQVCNSKLVEDIKRKLDAPPPPPPEVIV